MTRSIYSYVTLRETWIIVGPKVARSVPRYFLEREEHLGSASVEASGRKGETGRMVDLVAVVQTLLLVFIGDADCFRYCLLAIGGLIYINVMCHSPCGRKLGRSTLSTHCSHQTLSDLNPPPQLAMLLSVHSVPCMKCCLLQNDLKDLGFPKGPRIKLLHEVQNLNFPPRA